MQNDENCRYGWCFKAACPPKEESVEFVDKMCPVQEKIAFGEVGKGIRKFRPFCQNKPLLVLPTHQGKVYKDRIAVTCKQRILLFLLLPAFGAPETSRNDCSRPKASLGCCHSKIPAIYTMGFFMTQYKYGQNMSKHLLP